MLQNKLVDFFGEYPNAVHPVWIALFRLCWVAIPFCVAAAVNPESAADEIIPDDSDQDILPERLKGGKWHDVDENIICYYLKPHSHSYITDISCVRGLEWEK